MQFLKLLLSGDCVGIDQVWRGLDFEQGTLPGGP